MPKIIQIETMVVDGIAVILTLDDHGMIGMHRDGEWVRLELPEYYRERKTASTPTVQVGTTTPYTGTVTTATRYNDDVPF